MNRCEQDIAQPSFTESDVEAKKKAEAKLEKLKAKQEKSGSRVAWPWHGRGMAVALHGKERRPIFNLWPVARRDRTFGRLVEVEVH